MNYLKLKCSEFGQQIYSKTWRVGLQCIPNLNVMYSIHC